MTDDLISRKAAIETLKIAGDSAVTEAMGQRLCCSGDNCGCQGATVEEYLIHMIAAIPAAQPDSAGKLDVLVEWGSKPDRLWLWEGNFQNQGITKVTSSESESLGDGAWGGTEYVRADLTPTPPDIAGAELDALVVELSNLIADAEASQEDDAADAIHTGERTDFWEYDVAVNLRTAKRILTALRAKGVR